MICESFVVGNKLGLHARVAARFVQIASQFKSEIKLSRPDGNQTADGKSILEILMLAAREGTELVLTISGEDERQACESILNLISNKFGEK